MSCSEAEHLAIVSANAGTFERWGKKACPDCNFLITAILMPGSTKNIKLWVVRAKRYASDSRKEKNRG